MSNYSTVLNGNSAGSPLLVNSNSAGALTLSGSLTINNNINFGYDVNWLTPHVCQEAKSLTDENLQKLISELKKELALRNLKNI